MRMSEAGRHALLEPFEGCKLKAYHCPAGILTIGWGHTTAAGHPPVTENMSISQTEANAILSTDLQKFEEDVENMLTVKLDPNQFDVLVDFCYNAGPANLKASGILRRVNAGQFDKVPDELMKWTKGGGKVLPGLVRRCQARVSWWNAGANQNEDPEDRRVTPTAPPVPKTMADSKQGNAAIATGALGALGAVNAAAPQIQQASDTFTQLRGVLSNVNFDIMIGIIILGAAIWYWRNQHMQETGE